MINVVDPTRSPTGPVSQGARLLIVDDHSVARHGVQMLAERALPIDVTAHAFDEESALAAASEVDPTLIVLDLRMPGVDPVELCGELRNRHPGAKVVMLTAFEDIDTIRACLGAGAHGCLLKDSAPTDFGETLRRVVAGDVVLDPRVAQELALKYSTIAEDDAVRLTDREHEVLMLLADGLSNRAIGARLHLAESTIKGHVAAILEKLGAGSRLQAVVLAQRLGLVR